MSSRTSFGFLLLAGVVGFGQPAFLRAQNATEPTFEADLRPLFKKHCSACHNQKKLANSEVSGGLALDSFQAIQTAKAKKPSLFEGGTESHLLQRLMSKDDEKRMPQGGEPLSTVEIALVRRWLDGGLKQGEPVAAVAEHTPAGSNVRKRNILFTTSYQAPRAALNGQSPKLQLQIPHGVLAPITALAYSPDGKILAAGSFKQLVLWDTENVQPLAILFDVPGAIHDVRFNASGTTLAVAGGQPGVEGQAWLYDIKQQAWTRKLQVGQDLLTGAAFDPAGHRIALASADKKIYLCNLDSGKLEQTLTGHSDAVNGVSFTPDGAWLLSVGKDRALKITSASTGKTKSTLSGTNEEEMALAIHPNGKEAVSSGGDPSISWWELGTGKRIRRLRGQTGTTHDLAFDGKGALLASVGPDQTVHLWNGKTGAAGRMLLAYTPLYAVAVTQDGKHVAAGGFDGSVIVWESSTGRRLLTLCAFRTLDGDGQWLAYVPEGYLSAGAETQRCIKWTGLQKLTPNYLWYVLNKPNFVSDVASGKAVPAPGTRPAAPIRSRE